MVTGEKCKMCKNLMEMNIKYGHKECKRCGYNKIVELVHDVKIND